MQKEFASKYFDVPVDELTSVHIVTVSRMCSGHVVNIDWKKCASILNTSTDFLLGVTKEFEPCLPR